MEDDKEVLIHEDDLEADVQVETEGQSPGCCGKNGTCYRYMALFHMCVIGFGSCFCFDNPGALQDVISNDLSLSTTQFSYIYSIYSWPNVILCFIGGFLIDRIFGIKLGTVLYTTIVVIGQLVFALGGFLQSYWVIMLGRLIFGIGGESLAVAQNYYAVQWFRGKELNMVFGLQMSLSRIGSAVNFLVMGHLYLWVVSFVPEYEALGVTLLIAASTCIASLVSAIALAFMSSNTEPQEESEKEVAKLTDVLFFPLSFWLICFICITYYIAIFPFIALSKVFLMRKYDYPPAQANAVTSLLYIVSAVASPLFGILIDKAGRNITFVVGSIIVSVGAHAGLAFTMWPPVPLVTILGLAYSLLASALWPMIALVIPDHQLGSAYGAAQALQNTGLAGATLLAGLIVDNYGYFRLEIFFVVSLILALAAGFLMWMLDVCTTGVLNMTIEQRNQWEKLGVINEDSADSGGAGTSYDTGVRVTAPQTSHAIRNRYLARLGGATAAIPDHLEAHQYMYRNLR